MEKDRLLYLVTGCQTKVDLLNRVVMGKGWRAKAVLPVGIDERDWERSPLGKLLLEYSHHSSLLQSIAVAKMGGEPRNGQPTIATDADKRVEGSLLHKPVDLKAAAAMIMDQSERECTQIAATVFWNGDFHFGVARVGMPLREIGKEEARGYVNRHSDVLNVAGAIPIADPEGIGFYRQGPYNVIIEHYYNSGSRETVFEGTIGSNDEDLVPTVYGFSPALLGRLL